MFDLTWTDFLFWNFKLVLAVYEYIYHYFFTSELGMIEFVASVLTLICVYQVTQRNIWSFLWGGIGNILFGYIFYKSLLYADMTLQWAYFVPISLYGWWYWYYKGDIGHDNLKISTGTYKQWGEGILFLVAGVLAAGSFYHYMGAALPYPDSYILVASILGQYLLSKKVLESWLLWITVDLVAVPVYFYKELYVTSGLYLILLFLATAGLISWYKEWVNYDNWIDSREVPSVSSRT